MQKERIMEREGQEEEARSVKRRKRKIIFCWKTKGCLYEKSIGEMKVQLCTNFLSDTGQVNLSVSQFAKATMGILKSPLFCLSLLTSDIPSVCVL